MKVGEYYVGPNGHLYMLAYAGSAHDIYLVNISNGTGTHWGGSVKVKDPQNISAEEFALMTGWGEWQQAQVSITQNKE